MIEPQTTQSSQPEDCQDRLLNWLYNGRIGRMLLPLAVRPAVTHLGGAIMNSRISRRAIPRFIRSNNIDMTQFEQREFTSYNDFFTRKILPGARPICEDADALISPCDSVLSAYPISADARFQIKGTDYTLQQLLRDEALAQKYLGGTLLVFRLTVADYHRYCYAVTGEKSRDTLIPGIFNTVNPIAAAVRPIYKENTRVHCTISTQHLGDVLQMEVGALMVGKIVNEFPDACHAAQGAEKGRFEFGGSTIIVCLQPDVTTVNPQYFENAARGIETPVRYGQRIN